MLVLVEEFLLHTCMPVLVRCFSYTPHASFSEGVSLKHVLLMVLVRCPLTHLLLVLVRCPLTHLMLVLVGCFSYTPVAGFVWCFSYTPRASFSGVFLLNTYS